MSRIAKLHVSSKMPPLFGSLRLFLGGLPIILMGTYTEVSGATLEISRANFVSSWTAGVPYTSQLKAIGGSGDYNWSLDSLISKTTWDVAASGKDRRNFTISSSSGHTPTAGVDTFFVSLVDNNATKVESTLVLTINPALGAITGACQPNTTVNRSITPVTYKVTGGTAPWRWSVAGQPSGISIDAVTGVLSGTPTRSGTYTMIIHVIDGAGVDSSKTCSWIISAPLGSIAGACPPTPWEMGRSIVPISYSVSGGTAPRVWSVAGQPGGISIDPSTGKLSGTPTNSGLFSLIIHVVDGSGVDSSKKCSWQVNSGFSMAGNCPPIWTIGQSIAPIQYSVQGGTPPYRWLQPVTLPSGMVFDTALGKLTGTPTQAGLQHFSIRVADNAGESDSLPCTWTLNPIPEIIGSFNTAWTAGKGVNPPLTFSRSKGTPGVVSFGVPDTLNLPAGVTRRNSANKDTLYLEGVIKGSVAGSFGFQIELVDGAGSRVSSSCALKVNPWTSINKNIRPPKSWVINTGLVHQYAIVTGTGTSPTSWSKGTGIRAAWIQINSSGLLTGVPGLSDTGWTVFYSKVCDFRNACDSVRDSIFVSRDRVGPELIPNSLRLTQRNDSAVLSITAKDRGGIDSAYAIWRLGGAALSDSSIVPLTVESNAGDTLFVFSSEIARKGDVDVYGLEYRFRLVDGNNPRNQSFYPSNGAWMSGAPVVDPTRFDRTVSTFASDDTLWHLVSFPGVYYPDSVRVKDVLRALSSRSMPDGGNSDTWRLVEIDHTNSGSEGKVLWHVNDTITPGKGYWFRQFSYGSVNLHLPIQYPQPTNRLFPIALDSGWNLIGSPFLFPTTIDSISPGVNSLYGQRAGASPGSSDWWLIKGSSSGIEGVELDPWKGYAINCVAQGGCTIYLDPHRPASQSPRDVAGLWQSSIRFYSDGKLCDTVTLGVAATSSDEIDKRDLLPIPMFASAPALILKGPGRDALIRDFRSNTNEVHVWDIVVSDKISKSRLSFQWDARPLLNPGYSFMFRDVLENKTYDMTTRSVYELANCSQMPEGRFKVYYGPTEQVTENIQSTVTLVPADFHLYPSFPNPFNPSTTILFDLPARSHVRLDIFNILGQIVTTMIDEDRGPGSYSILWNGLNPSQGSVATGVYFARLTADNFRGTIRMLLIK